MPLPRLLIVDDELTYADLLAEVFEDHGYEVTAAASGPEGVEKAFALIPDVILMDVMMPGLSGWAAVSRLKADPRTRHVPVVMMTGRLVEAAKSATGPSEAVAVLQKPIPVDLLLETVDRAIGRESTS